jgi:putative Ca2+/H+ antiporter (TMEM165/GDT1 family)
MTHRRYELEEGESSDGPEIKAKGRLRDWIVGGLMLITAVKSWVPATQSADQAARLEPIYKAISDVKTTMEVINTNLALVNQTVALHTAELTDHEQRLRAGEQWLRTTGKP